MSNYSGRELVMVEMDRVLPKLQTQSLIPASPVAFSIFSLPDCHQPVSAGFFRPDTGLCISAFGGFGLPSQFHNGVFNNE